MANDEGTRRMKRDRQRARRQASLRAQRLQDHARALPPEQRCPKCGSRMGRFRELAPGVKAQCGNGHVWVGKEGTKKSAIDWREEIRAAGEISRTAP